MSETRTPAEEPAHDVLAAEMYGMPGADPELHHGPVRPPEDPAGIPEPHDVLAAEEFPMPAPRTAEPGRLLPGSEPHHSVLLLVALGLLVLMLRRRRRRRRPSA